MVVAACAYVFYLLLVHAIHAPPPPLHGSPKLTRHAPAASRSAARHSRAAAETNRHRRQPTAPLLPPPPPPASQHRPHRRPCCPYPHPHGPLAHSSRLGTRRLQAPQALHHSAPFCYQHPYFYCCCCSVRLAKRWLLAAPTTRAAAPAALRQGRPRARAQAAQLPVAPTTAHTCTKCAPWRVRPRSRSRERPGPRRHSWRQCAAQCCYRNLYMLSVGAYREEEFQGSERPMGRCVINRMEKQRSTLPSKSELNKTTKQAIVIWQ